MADDCNIIEYIRQFNIVSNLGYNVPVMLAGEIRKKYLDFFKRAPRSHKEIAAAPLVLENDPTTLFTSAGMQPLIPNLMGEVHPEGKRLVNVQPSVRTVDIDEVGDLNHTTFFEMLGNWSLGDYFKREQLSWVWEFLTKELGLAEERLWATCFAGGNGVKKDIESYEILKKLGVPEGRIAFYEDNWWSRSGLPEEMPEGEIGGPDCEVFFEFDGVVDEKYGEVFHPDSRRFLEIGNSVFIEYKKLKRGLEELPQRNVDFGGGLERMAAAVNNDPDIFMIDTFKPVVRKVEEMSEKSYVGNEREMRVVVDHLKAAVFLLSEGVRPGNKLQGYVLRRLIRRAVVKMRALGGSALRMREIVRVVTDIYPEYFEKNDFLAIEAELGDEIEKFSRVLERGMRVIEKLDKIDSGVAFDLFQSYGFPVEITEELLEARGRQKLDRKEFRREFEKHREKSRKASAGVFKGGLADSSEEVKKLHTVTHLLYEALRRVLGEGVAQKGSNITSERARFDFSYGKKLTKEQVAGVEKLVDEQIKRKLAVTSETMSLEEAKRSGALAFFGEKYPEKVKVYKIGGFSKEVCGGPHVENLVEIGGRVKIIKEEGVARGVRRVYAVIEKTADE